MVQATKNKLSAYRIDSGPSLLYFAFIVLMEFTAVLIHAEAGVHASITTLAGAHGFGHYVHHIKVDAENGVHQMEHELSRL